MAVVHVLETMVGGAEVAVAEEPGTDAPAGSRGQPRVVTLQKRPAARPTAEEQIPFGDTGTFGKF